MVFSIVFYDKLSIWIISQYHQGWQKGSQNHFHLSKKFDCENKEEEKKKSCKGYERKRKKGR